MTPLKGNIAAVVEAMGMDNIGLVWCLSNVNWESEEDRDVFLEAITSERSGQ
jgi:hypothetical protein